MKRRTFIFAAVASIALPIGAYTWYHLDNNPLTFPKELSLFCNNEELFLIGKAYIDKNPLENSENLLKKYLLTDDRGNSYKVNSKTELVKWLDVKIIEDFKLKNFLILNGWVISRTEAQQCALLSLT